MVGAHSVSQLCQTEFLAMATFAFSHTFLMFGKAREIHRALAVSAFSVFNRMLNGRQDVQCREEMHGVTAEL